MRRLQRPGQDGLHVHLPHDLMLLDKDGSMTGIR